MTRKKTGFGLCFAAWAGALLLLPPSGDLRAAVADVEEGGTVLSAAEPVGAVSFSAGSASSLTITFAAMGSPPAPVGASVTARPEDVFGGDYTAAGVQGVSFRLQTEGFRSSHLLVFLRGRTSGRLWSSASIALPKEGATIQYNQIALDRVAGGWHTDYPGDPDVLWRQDLHDVGAIGISVGAAGRTAQSVTLADFRLVGEKGFVTLPAELTALEQALFDRFGVLDPAKVTDADQKADTDKDGMTDVHEIRFERDPAFEQAMFLVQALWTVSEEGLVIRWPGVKGARYAVYRTTDLQAGFAGPAAAAGLAATNTGYMTYRDGGATGAGPYFYRIRKE